MQDHRDWHTQARSEGVNAWDCPWDCTDPAELFDGEDDAPGPYAYILNPNLRGEYPVFSERQMAVYAGVLAGRLDAPVQVRLAADDSIQMVQPPPEPEFEECPHGLSLALCADPFNHYGSDNEY